MSTVVDIDRLAQDAQNARDRNLAAVQSADRRIGALAEHLAYSEAALERVVRNLREAGVVLDDAA